MPHKCSVHNCTNQVSANDLCQKHYMQVQRHGKVGNTRPDDWGKREKHTAYKTWCGLRKSHRQDMSLDWIEDFWKFAGDVGHKPSQSTAFRPDKSKAWSKDNFYWKEHGSSTHRTKEYARQWHKKARANNPDYYRDKDLIKLYGVTLEWYRNKLSEQNGVCAICKCPELAVIRGKTISMPVDHCHTTGKARGLLCTKCNRALGLFRDNVDVLKSAIQYLDANSEGA